MRAYIRPVIVEGLEMHQGIITNNEGLVRHETDLRWSHDGAFRALLEFLSTNEEERAELSAVARAAYTVDGEVEDV